MASPAFRCGVDADTVEFVEVCAEGKLQDGEKIDFDIDGQRVLLERFSGSYYTSHLIAAAAACETR